MLRRVRKSLALSSAPHWMVSYADLMTLMLAFFVLLVSFSEVERGKLEQALMSIQRAMGGAGLATGLALVPTQEQPANVPMSPKRIERVARQVQERLQIQGLDRDVRVRYDGQGGLRIIVPCGLLFDRNQARLKASAETQRVLDDLGGVLSSLTGPLVEIRGYSDDRPLRDTSVFRDNYELTFARAMAVARYLHTVGRMPLQRFEVDACGPCQPVATNATPEGRAANRRIEVHIRGAMTPLERDETQAKVRAMERH